MIHMSIKFLVMETIPGFFQGGLLGPSQAKEETLPRFAIRTSGNCLSFAIQVYPLNWKQYWGIQMGSFLGIHFLSKVGETIPNAENYSHIARKAIKSTAFIANIIVMLALRSIGQTRYVAATAVVYGFCLAATSLSFLSGRVKAFHDAVFLNPCFSSLAAVVLSNGSARLMPLWLLIMNVYVEIFTYRGALPDRRIVTDRPGALSCEHMQRLRDEDPSLRLKDPSILKTLLPKPEMNVADEVCTLFETFYHANQEKMDEHYVNTTGAFVQDLVSHREFVSVSGLFAMFKQGYIFQGVDSGEVQLKLLAIMQYFSNRENHEQGVAILNGFIDLQCHPEPATHDLLLKKIDEIYFSLGNIPLLNEFTPSANVKRLVYTHLAQLRKKTLDDCQQEIGKDMIRDLLVFSGYGCATDIFGIPGREKDDPFYRILSQHILTIIDKCQVIKDLFFQKYTPQALLVDLAQMPEIKELLKVWLNDWTLRNDPDSTLHLDDNQDLLIRAMLMDLEIIEFPEGPSLPGEGLSDGGRGIDGGEKDTTGDR